MRTLFCVTGRVIILALMIIGLWGGSGSRTAAAQVGSDANTPSSGEDLLKKYPQRDALPTQADDTEPFVSSPFNLYAEAFGTAGFGSINAEFVRPISSGQGLALRTGYSRLDAANIIPVSVSLLHGTGPINLRSVLAFQSLLRGHRIICFRPPLSATASNHERMARCSELA